MNATGAAIFVLPFFVGATIRLLFLKWNKGHLLSALFAFLSVIAWLWTKHLVRHGVDGTVLLWALMATELTVGSLLAGGISLVIKKSKH